MNVRVRISDDKSPYDKKKVLNVFSDKLKKELHSIQKHVYENSTKLQDLPLTDFMQNATEIRCKRKDEKVHLDTFRDIHQTNGNNCLSSNDLVEKNKSFKNESRCSVTKLSVNEKIVDVSLDENTVFELGDKCFANRPAQTNCPTFYPFMPKFSESSLFEVLKEGCFYDIATDSGSFLVKLIKRNNDAGLDDLVFAIVEKILENDFSKSRRVDNDLSIVTENVLIEIHEVNAYRGPCIRENFMDTRTDPKTGLCKYNYSRFISTSINEWNYGTVYDIESQLIPHSECIQGKTLVLEYDQKGKIDQSDQSEDLSNYDYVKLEPKENAIPIYSFFEKSKVSSNDDLGLSTYLRSRLGFSKILTSIEIPSHDTKLEADRETPGMVTSSVLFSRTLNKDSKDLAKSIDPEILRYGIHEKDALLTLQRFLHRNKKEKLTVVHNTNFFKYRDTFGGTPDGFVLSGDTIVATVEVKSHMHVRNVYNGPRSIPGSYALQAMCHPVIMTGKGITIQKSYFVSWSTKGSRIYEIDYTSDAAEFIDKCIDNPNQALVDLAKFNILKYATIQTYSVQSVIKKSFTCFENNKLGSRMNDSSQIIEYADLSSSTLCNRIDTGVIHTGVVEGQHIIDHIKKHMNGKCYTHDTFICGEKSFRAKIKLNSIRKEGSIVYIQDTLNNSVSYRTFNLFELRDTVDDYKEYSFLDLFFEIFQTTQLPDKIEADIPILPTYNEDGKLASDDLFAKQYMLISEPVFKSWDDFKNFEESLEKSDYDSQKVKVHKNTVSIQLNNVTYIVPITSDTASSESEKVTTDTVFQLNETKFKNFCIESTQGFQCYVLININSHQLLDVLITQEVERQMYDERFWKRLFFLLSCFDTPKVNLTIDKKIMDKKGVQDTFLQSYVSFKNQFHPRMKLQLTQEMTIIENPSSYTKTDPELQVSDDQVQHCKGKHSAFDVVKSGTKFYRPPITKASEILDKVLFHKANANIVFTSNNINNAIRNLKMDLLS